MIALDENSKPYYYIVSQDDTENQKIDFTEFTDAEGNAYKLKDIKRTEANNKKATEGAPSYTDVCGEAYDCDVVLERYK